MAAVPLLPSWLGLSAPCKLPRGHLCLSGTERFQFSTPIPGAAFYFPAVHWAQSHLWWHAQLCLWQPQRRLRHVGSGPPLLSLAGGVHSSWQPEATAPGMHVGRAGRLAGRTGMELCTPGSAQRPAGFPSAAGRSAGMVHTGRHRASITPGADSAHLAFLGGTAQCRPKEVSWVLVAVR